jgi:hypothetical protein
MTDTDKTRSQELLGDTAPELVRLTDEVLFGQADRDLHRDVWVDGIYAGPARSRPGCRSCGSRRAPARTGTALPRTV